jgi:hypothetical protein
MTGKATVTLAANAQDPEFQEMMIEYLNTLQPDVVKAHKSSEGAELLLKLEEAKRIKKATLESRKRAAVGEFREIERVKEAAKDLKNLPSTPTFLSGPRIRKAVRGSSMHKKEKQAFTLSVEE